MSISAKFIADFSSFESAVEQAETKLVSFQGNAGKVESALNRMVDNFSGRKLIQDATLMAEAVDRVGGVSKLTEEELQRVGARAQEAADKLRAMGLDVPPKLQNIVDTVRDGSAATHGWIPILHELGSSWVARITEGILLRDAIREVISAIKGVAEALPELALKGAKVAEVEESFRRLTTQAGLLGDQLLGALRTGSRNTVTDFELMQLVNKDLAAGLQLTRDQFGTLTTGAFTLARATGTDVKTALDTMNDAMLTGRARSLALLTGKVDLTAAEDKFARSLGATRDQLSEAGKLEATRAAILDAVASATQRLGEHTDGLNERVQQARVSWDNFTENLGKAIATSKVLEAGMTGLKQALADTFGDNQQAIIAGVVKKIEEAEIAIVTLGQAGVTAAGFLVKEYYAVQKVLGDLAQIIDGNILAFKYLELAVEKVSGAASTVGTINKEIDALLITMSRRGAALQADDAAQQSVDATTAKYVATLQQLHDRMVAASGGTEATASKTKALAEAADSASGAAGRLGQSFLDATKLQAEFDAIAIAGFEKRIAGLQKVTEANLKAYDFKGQVESLYSLITAEEALARAVYDQITSEKDRAKIIEQLTLRRIELATQIQQIEEKQAQVVNRAILAELAARKELEASYGRNIDGTIGEMTASEKLTAALNELHARRVEGISQYYEEQVLMEKFTKGLYDEAVAQDKATAAAAGHTQALKDQAEAAKAAQDLANRGSVAVPTSDSLTKAGIIQSAVNFGADRTPWWDKPAPRADGGPVSAGTPYMVGERGPELFTPSSSGTITPAGGSTGPQVIQLVVDGRVLSEIVTRQMITQTGGKFGGHA